MTSPNNGPQDVNKWLITIAVMAGTFMEIVDTTVVTCFFLSAIFVFQFYIFIMKFFLSNISLPPIKNIFT